MNNEKWNDGWKLYCDFGVRLHTLRDYSLPSSLPDPPTPIYGRKTLRRLPFFNVR